MLKPIPMNTKLVNIDWGTNGTSIAARNKRVKKGSITLLTTSTSASHTNPVGQWYCINVAPCSLKISLMLTNDSVYKVQVFNSL